MKREFKVGDRVRVFGYGSPLHWEWEYDGTVSKVHAYNNWLYVQPDKDFGASHSVHMRQCKRLVKKKRREWILQGDPVACVSSYVHRPTLGPELAMGEQVRVREVKERK